MARRKREQQPSETPSKVRRVPRIPEAGPDEDGYDQPGEDPGEDDEDLTPVLKVKPRCTRGRKGD